MIEWKRIWAAAAILACVGCGAGDSERVDSVTSRQIDPGIKDYSIFTFTIEDDSSTQYDLAQVLVMAEDVGSYVADTEYWRFSSSAVRAA